MEIIVDNEVVMIEKGNKWPGVCQICGEKSEYTVSLKHGKLTHSMVYCEKHFNILKKSFMSNNESPRCNRGRQGHRGGTGVASNTCKDCTNYDGLRFCFVKTDYVDNDSVCKCFESVFIK